MFLSGPRTVLDDRRLRATVGAVSLVVRCASSRGARSRQPTARIPPASHSGLPGEGAARGEAQEAAEDNDLADDKTEEQVQAAEAARDARQQALEDAESTYTDSDGSHGGSTDSEPDNEEEGDLAWE